MTWDRYPESIFMVSEGEVLFEQDWKNNYLFCKYSKVWSLFESKFEYNNMQINDMISGILEEHFKNGTLTPRRFKKSTLVQLEEHFKNGTLTPVGPFAVILEGVEEHLKKGSLTPYHFPFHAINELEEQVKKEALTPTYRGGYKSSQLQEKMSIGTLNPEIAPIRITNRWNNGINQNKLT
jgi:hypothetical protein